MGDDQMGREGFCRALAVLMVNACQDGSEGSVISVEGDWGEGKTSSVEMAIDCVGREHADLLPFVVRITPWRIGGQNELIRYFLSEMMALLPRERAKIAFWTRVRVGIAFAQYVDAISLVRGDPNALAAGVLVRGVAWILNRVAETAINVDAIKQRLSTHLNHLNRPIIVFVDDVDRMSPSEVLETFRFVREVGDFSAVTYVLAYDRPRVVESLAAAGIPRPEHFLEKMVTASAHLPPPEKTVLRELFISEASRRDPYLNRRVFPESETRGVEILDFFLSGMFRSPRSIKRVIAKIDSVPLAVFEDIEYWDVVGMSAISVLSPGVFELIRRSPGFFVNEWKDLSGAGRGNTQVFDEFKRRLDKEVDAFEHSSVRYLRGLLRALFPMFDESEKNLEDWLSIRGRVGAGRNLRAYLNLSLGENNLPLSLIDAVVRGDSSAAQELRGQVTSVEKYAEMSSLLVEELKGRPEGGAWVNPSFRALVKHWSWLCRKCDADAFDFDVVRPVVPLVAEFIRLSTEKESILDALLRERSTIALGALTMDLALGKSKSEVIDLTQFSGDTWARLASRLAAAIQAELVVTDPADAGRYTGSLYCLLRISDREFYDLLSALSGDSTSRRVLLVSLGLTIHSSADGQVASWPEELRLNSTVAPLLDEAQKVLSEMDADKALRASSAALLNGSEVSVSSGLKRR